MTIQFDVPANAPERRSPKKSPHDLKAVFNNPGGKKMIRDSLALKPISKERRKKELERFRKSFKMEEDVVTNLKSCLMVKKEAGDVDSVRWRESTEIVEIMRFSKVRASCWDDCYYTEDELADFKYEAFMEECGLDPSDFD
jgi:hypothetical protein